MGARPVRGERIPDEWIMVDTLRPVDTSNIQDKGMKGIAMLAVSLGWNLLQRRDAPAQLVSREGLTRNLPTDTGVRQSVFWSMLANILGHSDGRLPTNRLIDQIVKETGMSKAHAATLASKVALLARGGDDPEEEEPVEEEPVEEEPTPSAVALEPEPTPDFVMTERMEPTLNMATDGGQYVSPIMDTVIRQLVEDGADQITYRCKHCGLEFETKRGCGAHWQVHVKAGEAEATAGKTKVIVNVIPDYEPTEVHLPREGSRTAELQRLRRIVADIQRAVGQDAIKEAERRAMVAERKYESAIAELTDLREQYDSLQRSLDTFQELFGELRKPTNKEKT